MSAPTLFQSESHSLFERCVAPGGPEAGKSLTEPRLVAYGESNGPPTSWPRYANGPFREQCDDDTVLEQYGTEGLDFGGVEVGESNVDVF